ncbi:MULTISPECIES: hypothetical protein [Pseudoalteromonas]|uniref:hypothetical protein n=1 Tax=Pseudoalteromonas TaxID=53246 RepID=UPI001582059E|nr:MULTISPECIES: hypothetical protein [Pseudoalteromonas]MDI4653621.1 hypothetical protein [Pseudoalteromonas shioyasakiensis]MDP4488903.1 hypothetical protein [Pseudoalteromonas piscicida]NUJ39344.1 hypothetical protein [Pseudoalteromonas sp. 0303]
MKFLIWFNQVRILAEKRQYKSWEKKGQWRDWFHAKLTPEVALNKAMYDKF